VFTGIVLAAQVHNNKLTLQTPLASLLPALGAFPDSRVQRITLEQLATHTAGLPRMPSGAFRPVNIWKTIIASDSYRAYTEQDVLAVIPRKTSPEPSDLRFRYSNAGFGLLGMILSEESGMTYHDLIQTTIANPLGLKDTGVMLDEEQHARVAAGYRSYLHLGSFYLAQRSALWDFPNCMAGAGGIRSSAADMLVFLNALLGRTRTELTPVFQESQNLLFTNKEMQIGMGWVHATLPASGEAIIWHNGGTGGYSSFLGLTANKRFGVCVLSNSARSVDDIGYRILDALITS
jgi:CubicO group peptidase (beta-lactamase class C family)